MTFYRLFVPIAKSTELQKNGINEIGILFDPDALSVL